MKPGACRFRFSELPLVTELAHLWKARPLARGADPPTIKIGGP